METINKYKVPLLFLFAIAVQAIWVAYSDGFYFIDDSCHFNYNRHFAETYNISIGAWHRVGRVWLYALPAQFGLKGVQIASSLLFMLTIYFAYKILKLKGVKYAEWVIPFIAFQPVLFNISFTSLAELPAAFLIVLSCYFYLKDKWVWVMLCSSLIFIFRTEFYFVSGLFLLLYLYKKRWLSLILILAGPVIWYGYSTILSMNPMQFFTDMGLHARLPRIEEGIDWYYYLYHAPKVYGFIQAIFFIVAIFTLLYKKKIADYGIFILIAFGGIALHTLLALKGLNLTCSVGQLRYIAIVGPMIGIISAVGINYLYETLKSKYQKAALTVLFMFIIFIFGPYSTPFHNKYQIEKDAEKIAEIVNTKYKDYMVLSNLHYIANALDAPASGGRNFQNLTPENIRKYDKAVIVWESSLETSPFFEGEREHLKELENNSKLKLIQTFNDTVNNCKSIPLYNRFWDDNEYAPAKKIFIDYMIKDQTTWENVNIKVFVKE